MDTSKFDKEFIKDGQVSLRVLKPKLRFYELQILSLKSEIQIDRSLTHLNKLKNDLNELLTEIITFHSGISKSRDNDMNNLLKNSYNRALNVINELNNIMKEVNSYLAISIQENQTNQLVEQNKQLIEQNKQLSGHNKNLNILTGIYVILTGILALIALFRP